MEPDGACDVLQVVAEGGRETVSERLRELGAIPVGGPPERLAEHLRAEQTRFRDVISRTNIKPE